MFIFALLMPALLSAPAHGAGFADKGFIEARWSETGFISTRLVRTPTGFVLGATVSKFLFIQPGWAEIQWFHEDGTLDTSFGKDGLVKIPLRGQTLVQKIVPSPAGGYFAVAATRAGMTEDFDLLVLRLGEDGNLKAAYGKNGASRIDLDFGSEDFATDAIAEPDGSLLLAVTTAEQNEPRTAIVKLGADGSLDPFFGDSGLIEISVPKGSNPIRFFRDSHGLSTIFYGPGGTANRAFAVRIADDGKLDSSFGKNGVSELGFPEGVPSAIQQVEERAGGGYWILGAAGEPGKGDILAGRLDAQGRPDGFAGTGYVKVQPPAGAKDCNLGALGEGQRGELTAVGRCSFNKKTRLVLAQWGADGAPDPAFGVGGYSIYEPPAPIQFGISLLRVRDGWVLEAAEFSQKVGASFLGKFDEKGKLMAPASGGQKP